MAQLPKRDVDVADSRKMHEVAADRKWVRQPKRRMRWQLQAIPSEVVNGLLSQGLGASAPPTRMSVSK
jgi:hypothetical protein